MLDGLSFFFCFSSVKWLGWMIVVLWKYGVRILVLYFELILYW